MGNVFNNNISGGAQNIAQGSSEVSQTVNARDFAAGDTTSFLRALRDTGEVSDADVDDLSAAIDEDNPDGTPEGRQSGSWPSGSGLAVSARPFGRERLRQDWHIRSWRCRVQVDRAALRSRMSLLNEIVDGVDSMPVATLLRKVTILARRLKSDPLTAWVHHELTGYKEDSDIPDYRGPFPASVQGNFLLPYQKSPSRLEIAPIGFPENLRDTNWFKVIFIQPIAEIEAATAGGQPAELQLPWNADFVKYVNHLMQNGEVRLYTNALLLNAWRSVNGLQLRGIVDTVRTRLLHFALALEEIEPTAGDPGATAPEPAVVTTVVNNYIFDSTVNLAQASQHVAQTMTDQAPTDPVT